MKNQTPDRPVVIEDMEIQWTFVSGLGAYCLERNAKRVLMVDRILEICVSSNESPGIISLRFAGESHVVEDALSE